MVKLETGEEAALKGALGAFFIATIIFFLVWRFSQRKKRPPRPEEISVQVLVLGDIGRSPRMQYHALSVVQHGAHVTLIGYIESPLLADLLHNGRVTVVPLNPPPKYIRMLPFIVSGPLKVLWQIYDLVAVLMWKTERAKWLLVQNPPSIPTLAVATFVSYARWTSLIIDWHNYGWSILAGTRGSKHPFVSVSKTYEQFFGRWGTVNLTVTSAMARQLRKAPYRIQSPIAVMHDRPAAIFRPITSTSGRLHFLARILESREHASAIIEGRLRLIVSSTSWTPDEDFQLLLDALVQYCEQDGRPGRPIRPPILAVITGKGPQKAMYQAKIAELQTGGHLHGVEIKTAFLPMEDYASLLASADLGVCLHKSSSGVDLPMKVVDMFGAGLPVVAYSDYESFPELVKEGVNGRGFKTSGGLSDHLALLLSRVGQADLKKLKTGAMRESYHRWAEEWDKVVAPILWLPTLQVVGATRSNPEGVQSIK